MSPCWFGGFGKRDDVGSAIFAGSALMMACAHFSGGWAVSQGSS
jgi:hypothetical protein